IDAAKQQSGVARSIASSDDVCLGPAKTGRDGRSSAERNENNRSATRKLVSGNEQGRNDRRHAASRKSRRQISDESRVIVRRGWVGVADRVREPGESFCRPRSSAGA